MNTIKKVIALIAVLFCVLTSPVIAFADTDTYQLSIAHWAWGFENMEGMNAAKNAYQLASPTVLHPRFNSNYELTKEMAVEIPNGYVLDGMGTSDFSALKEWHRYDLPYTIQNYTNTTLYIEYRYSPISYTITYNLNGGTNSNANPRKYNVLYGVSLAAPTRIGYTFEGWYNAEGKKITGINEGATAQFINADDLYQQLKTRETGDIELTAHWRQNTITINYMNDGAQTWRTYPEETTIDCSKLSIAQTETVGYYEAYPHAMYGVLDVNRFKKQGCQTYQKWKVGSKDSSLIVFDTNWDDDRKNNATGKTVAEFLHVESQFETGDVVVNLWPLFSDSGTLIASDGDKPISTTVNAEIPSSYSLIVPESISLTGGDGSGEKSGILPVRIKGDIGLTEKIELKTIAPTMKHESAKDVLATIDTPKTQWDRTDALANDGNGTTSNYIVKATLTPGDWSGTAEFSCSIAAS